MSNRFATSIEIGGKIPRSKVETLIGIINSSNMSHDWGESPLIMESEDDLLCAIHPDRKTLTLVDLERTWGDTSDIEEQLQDELGSEIIYKIIVEPKYEYSGELRFWSPETRLVESNCGADGLPIAHSEDLNEILKLLKDHLLYKSVFALNKSIEKLEKLIQGYKIPFLEIIQ